MGKLLTLSSLTLLAFAGTAAAANSGNISVSLSPNKVSKSSKLSVTASGFPAAGLPTSAQFTVQKGFISSAKSVPVLCSAAQASSNSCPAGSKIGSGSASVTGTYLGLTIPDTVSFSMFLGAPSGGDIASVVVTGSDSYLHDTVTGSGLLQKSAGGGLTLSFPHFPTIQNLPSGATITLNSLSLSASASRTAKITVGKGKHKKRKKVTYALITNPSTCAGSWTGSATVVFPSGPITKPLSTSCTK